MKKLFLCMAIVSVWLGFLYAKGADVTEVREVETVLISSYTWTAIPAVARNDDRRIAMQIEVDTNTVNTVYMIYSSSSVPTQSTATYIMVYKESDPSWIISINNAVNLFGIAVGSLAGGTTMYIQQLRGSF